MRATRTGAGFVAYLPRLARGWEREAGDATHRVLDGSLVSVDISGFTALSEKLAARGRAGAEELILLISGLFEGLIGVTRRHGGDVLKFRGDALLLFFDGEEHARRACRAAAEMQWLIETTGRTRSSVGEVRLRMSTGVESAPCHFFLAGTTHRELLVTGPAASAVVQLESAAEAGEVLVSAATAAAVDPAWLGGERGGARLLELPRAGAGAAAPAADEEDDDEDGDLEAYVPAPLRRHLAEDVLEPEHRQVTAAFVRFGGVDAPLAAEGAAATAERLELLGAAVGEAAARFGVTWLESDVDVDGGKLYLVAGAPFSVGDDEERMLLALRRILDADLPLPVQAGVNRGDAFAGEVGASSRRTYAVMGDVVNLAARLTARAGAGGLLATADVLDRSRTRFETEQQPFLVKGKERSIIAYRVGAALGRAEEDLEDELPLVGRDAELATLDAALDAARRRTSALVELVGEPGIGKSRLVEELKRRALGFTQLPARCGQYTTSAAYFPLRTLLRPLAGIRPDDPAQEAGAQLASWVAAVMPDLAPWLPLLAIPFDADVESTPEVDEIDPSFRRARLHEVVEQFLTRVLLMPTLVVVEDLHWADEPTLALLRHLVARPGPRPWLVCVTRRPDGESLVADDGGNGTRLELGALSAEAVNELAVATAADAPLPPDALAAVAARAGGNPLFLRELVAAARAGRAVNELPQTIESVITTRIDTLDPADRILLRTASVIGAVFELRLLGEVAAGADVRDLERWQRLAEFVARRDDETLQFRHDLFRAVAYEGLSYRRRREVHAAVAGALEARLADAEEAAELLSLHYARAGRHDKAWQHALAAGRRAQSHYANATAADLYERALAAAAELPELDPADVEAAAEALGDVSELAGRYDDAERAYARALGLVAGSANGGARLLLKQGVLCERTARYEEALGTFEEALGACDELALQVEIELAIAGARHRQGRFAEAVEWAERAAAHAEEAGSRPGLAHAYYLLDVAHTRLGDGETRYRSLALPIYEEIGDLLGQARVLNDLGVAGYFEGRWDEAADAWERSRELSQRAGDVVHAAIVGNNAGEILCDQGKLPEAEAAFEESLRVFRGARFAAGVHLATCNLARAAARAGRYDEAERLCAEAQRGFESIGAENWVLETGLRRLEALVLAGRHQEALALGPGLRERTGDGALGVAADRLVGYAYVQSRQPARAQPLLGRSVEAARAQGLRYELALTLRALALTGRPEHASESDALLAALGVEWVPAPPLP